MPVHTIRARLFAASGAPLTGPTVYAYRHRHGEAGQAVGADHPSGAGYLEIHTDLDAEEQWISGDVEIDGRRRFLEPFHRGLLESGRVLELRVGAGDVVRVVDPGAVVEPAPVDPPIDPPPVPAPVGSLPIRRLGDRFVSPEARIFRRAVGCYPWLGRADRDPRALPRIARAHGLDGCRVFLALARNEDPFRRELYVSPWSDRPLFDRFLVAMLTEALALGVTVTLVLLDEPTRNTKREKSDHAGLPDSETSAGPYDIRTEAGARGLVRDVLSRVPAALLPALEIEAINEPSSEWCGDVARLEGWIASEAKALGVACVVSTAQDDGRPATDCGIVHTVPDRSIPDSLALAKRVAGDHHPKGLSTDGARLSQIRPILGDLVGAGLDWLEVNVPELTDPIAATHVEVLAALGRR